MRKLRSKFDCIAARPGRQLYFVTTTYDPKRWGVEDWKTANVFELADASEECWDAMTRDRHVSRFMDRLGEAVGEDFSGRWWSKREFTKAGFVHNHLLIEGPEFLDYGKVHECWGFGRVDCQKARSHGGLAWYVGKYCTKYGDEPPAWILARPHGTARFTTSSDGWWSELHGDLSDKPRSVRDREGWGQAAEGSRPGTGRDADACPRPRHVRDIELDRECGCYESAGDRIERLSRTVVVRRPGKRVDVEGVTLEEFRRDRDARWYAKRVTKSRACMDAVAGLPVAQAVRELRLIASLNRERPEAGPDREAVRGGTTGQCEAATGPAAVDIGPGRAAVVGRSLILSSPQECVEGTKQGVLFEYGGGSSPPP